MRLRVPILAGSRGRYMIRCRNLTHEEHDVMTQFCVGEEGTDVDPFHGRAAAGRPGS